MIGKLMHTDSNDTGSLIARVVAGAVMLPHGLQKLLGMFGGYGFSATLDFFASSGLPKLIGFLIIMGESVGAVMLIVGLFSRFAAASLTIIMLGAIKIHLENGFFMNWFGNQNGEGFEFHILMVGLLLIVAIKGSGKWSVDSILTK
ncbi:MAG TPA: DoxX family protein [Thermodesulfobacteriota bacterium]|nr:DoxX family protein [Thermodesulfobacteriota bacterium]